MHDIKYIKENKKKFNDALIKRGLAPTSEKLVEKYDKYLSYLNKKQELQEKRNSITKSFKDSTNAEELKKQVQLIKKEIEDALFLSEKIFKELNEELLLIPNIADDKVPIGQNEKNNQIIKEYGEKKIYDFKTLDHVKLTENKDLLNYEQAVNLSGSRFSILKSELAKLNRALMNFFLDHNVENFGYTECVLPELVKGSSLIGTGQLPKFKDDLFQTNFNDLWLIPTAEVPLTNLNRNSIIMSEKLPLRYTSFTNCFRSEAGASGKDTKGLMREHQFGKVEIVSITDPDQSKNEFDRMLSCVESILKKLQLPYRLVELCSGDLGFSSTYTIDFEIWMPGQNQFREVSSCSNCGEFQSRRMKMRVKNIKKNKIYYPHSLNGSALALGRIIVGILENFQNADKSIDIPDVLQKYMNGIKKFHMKVNVDKNENKLELILNLRKNGINVPEILRAIEDIDRSFFVDSDLQDKSNLNTALPIDCGQTISQPLIVALMTQHLEVKNNMRVLEVGTGSGYQTLVLSKLAKFVYTIERYKTLHQKAKELLKIVKATNIFFRHGDGGLGWIEQAPFDRIIVTACAFEIPKQLLNQLSEDGIMIVPVGEIHEQQVLKKIKKSRGNIFVENLEKVRFVPLIEGIEKK